MELEPCPFCKKEAILISHEYGDCHPVTHWGVGCSDSECWAHADSDCCWHSTPKEAIELWHNRMEEILKWEGTRYYPAGEVSTY